MAKGQTPRRRALTAVFALVAAAAVPLALTGTAAAVHNDNLFELGNPAGDSGSADILGNGSVPDGPDWADLFTSTGARKDSDSNGTPDDQEIFGGITSTFISDPHSQKGATDPTTFSSSNKNNDAIGTWNWDSGNAPAKDDITNAYTYAKRNADDDLIIYTGVERIAPEGDSHLDVEFNQQDIGLDEAIPCNDPGNDPTPCSFTGAKTEDDILVVMDFAQGGALGFVEIRRWTGTEYELIEEIDGEGCDAADTACVFNNGGSIDGGPWPNLERGGGVVTNIETNAFTEFGFNVTDLVGAEPCINSVNVKSRTSGSFNSELKDFALADFEVCGDLAVHKYIDVNADGNFDPDDPLDPNDVPDVSSGTAVSGWQFSVKDSSAAFVDCDPNTDGVQSTITTDSTGTAECENVGFDTYTITELNLATKLVDDDTHFYNTDPGPITPPQTGTPSKTVVVNSTGGSTSFGNTCFVEKTFQVSGLGTLPIVIEYSTGGAYTASGSLTPVSGTATFSVNDTFTQANSISWRWYLASDSANKVTPAGSPESLATSGWPTCAKTNTDARVASGITGFKFKDVNADGDKDAGEPGLGGFSFELVNNSTNAVVQTVLSSSGGAGNPAVGTITFSNVTPGICYTIREKTSVSPPNWQQTAPATNPTRCVAVNQSYTLLDSEAFGNAPLSNITVTFNALADLPGTTTDATHATSISCTRPGSPPVSVGSNTNTNSLTTNNVLTNASPVTCVITFVDP